MGPLARARLHDYVNGVPVGSARTMRPRRRWLRLALVLASIFAAGASAWILIDLGGSAPPRAGAEGAVDAGRGDTRANGAPPVPGSVEPGDVGERPEEGSAVTHFALGADLARRNAVDAPGASKEGLQRAEAELAAALRLGHRDRPAAQRLLAQTYAALAHEWASTAEEQRAYQERERDARREIAAQSPADADARYRYAILLEDRRLRIRELAEAVRLAPRDPRSRRALGEDLLEEGKVEDGARQLVEAAELFDREELEFHGPTIMHLLRYHGREQDEERVRDRMERLGL